MPAAATVRLVIAGDARGAQAALSKTERAMKTTSGAASRMGGMMGAALGGAALLVAGQSIKAASDLQQAMGGVEAVFGDAAGTVKAFGDQAAETAGLSKTQYANLATVLGSQMKNAGKSQAEAAAASDVLIKRGADMAAVFGGSAKDAVEAVSSALKGERDPIERYGVSLNEAAIKARMVADGTDKLTGSAATAAKTQAAMAIIMDQTAQATGAFAGEADTLAGQTERMKANWENTKATLGEALLPILTQVAAKLSQVATFVAANVGWLAPLAAAIAVVVAIVKVWTFVQAAFNLVMAANPVVLIIIGIVLLIAAIAILWVKFEGFRNVVIAVWTAIKDAVVTAVMFVWNVTKTVWTAIFNFISAYLNMIWTVINAVWSAIVTIVTTYINLVRTVVTAVWRGIVVAVTTYVNLVRTVVSTVFRAIVALVSAIWSGVNNAIRAAWSAIRATVTAGINGVKAIVSTVLNGIKALVTGVWDAITSATRTAWNTLVNVITGPINIIKDAINNVWGLIEDFIGLLKRVKIPDALSKIPGIGNLLTAPAPPPPAPGPTQLATPRAAALPASAGLTGVARGAVIVQVKIGDRELTDIVDTRVRVADVALARAITGATGVLA
jgi:hypothetical protein